ncbi:alpha/beta hydrolase family protein [Jannaschia donghaensis]|uniref:Putative dienelactone hydrolase n=1 Tax=Jannaschia donghaensis TaxID=420998 RepID=A0A0M6YD77_9RHOB|nr:alpha/beta fold hydrolase [Jannaschia donghaensis]CTQ48298.1 putative dienelactone hydrolase [Jannaschia donghaensis]
MKNTLLIAAAALAAAPALAENPIDGIRPDAPDLAPYGEHTIGVRTMTFTDPGRIDVINSTTEIVTSDRDITVEVWYPAAAGTQPGGTYDTVLRDGVTAVTLTGRAARDAAPADGTFPLVLISHGYPGNRFLMSHLGENLASKGYVTVSADHPESIYSDQQAFISTLVNRPVDQAFLVDAMADLDDDIGAITDADRTAVIGYSMGGYGALIYGGAGLGDTAVTRTEPEAFTHPLGLLNRNAAGSDDHADLVDDRVKAIVAIGPWGRNRDFWDADSLAGLEKPLMLIAGGQDDVSEYPAMREIFEQTTGTTRHLLTFQGANHNAAAPMPAPGEAWAVSEKLGYAPFDHYADAVWDTTRMNNITQHFATAFLDLHLKGDVAKGAYLDLIEVAEEGAVDDDTLPYWPGFPDRTAKGLTWETLGAE